MNIYDVRMENYKALLREFKSRPDQVGLPNHGLYTRFCTECGANPRYHSHIIHGRKNIGNKTARLMETGFSKAEGWMDLIHDEGQQQMTPEERQFVALVLRLFRENPRALQALMLSYMNEQKETHEAPSGLAAEVRRRRALKSR